MKTLITFLSLLLIGIGTHAQNFNGMTKSVGYEKMITPLGIEITYNKTVHIIFPSEIKYVDLGNSNLVAGKVEAAENVLRIKASVENFTGETNFSVITADGSFYPFNARYAKEPELLNIEINDLLERSSVPNKVNVSLPELNGQSPALVDLILKSVYQTNKRNIKHLGCILFSVQALIRGLYTHDGILYVHTQLSNNSNIPYTIDFIRFKIIDKKLAKKTAMQERVITPLRTFNEETEVAGKSDTRTVFALPKFTLPPDKILLLEIYEKDGGRHQSVRFESTDIELAKTISKLKTN